MLNEQTVLGTKFCGQIIEPKMSQTRFEIYGWRFFGSVTLLMFVLPAIFEVFSDFSVGALIALIVASLVSGAFFWGARFKSKGYRALQIGNLEVQQAKIVVGDRLDASCSFLLGSCSRRVFTKLECLTFSPGAENISSGSNASVAWMREQEAKVTVDGNTATAFVSFNIPNNSRPTENDKNGKRCSWQLSFEIGTESFLVYQRFEISVVTD